jgi:hypothetical protein
MNASNGVNYEVSLILMQGSVEAQATLDVLEREDPELRIADHGTYWKITSPSGHLEVDLNLVSEELGSEISMGQWLVTMSSYVGRVITAPDRFIVTSDITLIERE